MFRKSLSKLCFVTGAFIWVCFLGAFLIFPIWLYTDAGLVFNEKYRVTSPDSKVDAVLMLYDAGATTLGTLYLYIVPSGKQISKWENSLCFEEPVFTAKYTENTKIQWQNNRDLTVHYKEDVIHHFQNSCWPLRPVSLDSEVKIKLTIDPR